MKRKSIQLSKPADSAYEDFLRGVKPIAMGLVECSSRLDREALGRLTIKKNGGVRIISTEYNLAAAEGGYFDATGRFSLAVAERAKSAPALVIQCTFETHFHCKAPVQKDMAERFTASELRLVLWPYFRELVFDLSGKMSIPPITIPLATTGTE